METEISGCVRAHLAKVLGIPPEAVRLDQALDSYGLDSVDAVLMAGELEDALQVEIDPAAFLRHRTLEAMILALEQQRSAGNQMA